MRGREKRSLALENAGGRDSWGNLYAQFDPRNPVAVATRAVADQGVTVVFAAGNSGDSNGEATLNPFSQAPWVISVAAETVDHVRGDFSSNGFAFDNGEAISPGPGGRTTFVGERVGLVHPDVAAPGVDISSSCDTTGAAVGPCPPGENTSASGTSMAAPHVAGVAAPFWQVGYGRVDLAEAVGVVRDPAALAGLRDRQVARNDEVLAATGYRVLRSDWLTYDAPRLSLGGSDSRSFEVDAAEGASHLYVAVAFPSTGALTDTGITSYTVTVSDAGGTVVATTERSGEGSASVLAPAAGAGPYTVEVTGDIAVSDPDTLDSDSLLNDAVTLQVAQLRAR